MVKIDSIMQKLHTLIVSLPGTWQRMLQHNIESYSFVEVEDIAGGGLSALQFIKKRIPNLIVIDSSIPMDDANALIQRVKDNHPDVQIIILTDTSYQRKNALRYGVDFAISSCNYEQEISEIMNKFFKSEKKDKKNFLITKKIKLSNKE